MSEEDLAEVYASRFGLSFDGGLLMEDFLTVVEKAVRRSGAYFILKVDGERTKNIFTFALGHPTAMRMDTDDLSMGMRFIFRRLEEVCAY